MKARLIDVPGRELWPVIRSLSDAGFDEDLAAAIRKPGQADRAVNAMRVALFGDPTVMLVVKRHQRTPLIHGMFVSPAEQVQNVIRWNKKYGWGFVKSGLQCMLGVELAYADRGETKWPEHSDMTVQVLVPYFATTGQTFEALWTIVGSRQKDKARYEGLRSGVNQLRYLNDGVHTPGLRWEVIDLAANWDKKDGIAPTTVRASQSSPHAGILAAGAHFPKWVRKMDGVKVPYVWLPGYQATIPDYDAWPDVPILRFDRSDRRVGLGAHRESYRLSDYAVPAFRE